MSANAQVRAKTRQGFTRRATSVPISAAWMTPARTLENGDPNSQIVDRINRTAAARASVASGWVRASSRLRLKSPWVISSGGWRRVGW